MHGRRCHPSSLTFVEFKFIEEEDFISSTELLLDRLFELKIIGAFEKSKDEHIRQRMLSRVNGSLQRTHARTHGAFQTCQRGPCVSNRAHGGKSKG